jgi:hypothetical protein
MKKNKLLKAGFLLAVFFADITAEANEAILGEMAVAAKKEDSSFKDFSAQRGEKLFRLERKHSKGESVSCMTCHTDNPKAMGKTRANKEIDPIAVVANSKRFTDMAKVEKWFGRNCKDVLERNCTALEKGDFVKFMMSVK